MSATTGCRKRSSLARQLRCRARPPRPRASHPATDRAEGAATPTTESTSHRVGSGSGPGSSPASDRWARSAPLPSSRPSPRGRSRSCRRKTVLPAPDLGERHGRLTFEPGEASRLLGALNVATTGTFFLRWSLWIGVFLFARHSATRGIGRGTTASLQRTGDNLLDRQRPEELARGDAVVGGRGSSFEPSALCARGRVIRGRRRGRVTILRWRSALRAGSGRLFGPARVSTSASVIGSRPSTPHPRRTPTRPLSAHPRRRPRLRTHECRLLAARPRSFLAFFGVVRSVAPGRPVWNWSSFISTVPFLFGARHRTPTPPRWQASGGGPVHDFRGGVPTSGPLVRPLT